MSNTSLFYVYSCIAGSTATQLASNKP